jgi:cell division protein FtsL
MNIKLFTAEPEKLAVSVIMALVLTTAILYKVVHAFDRLSEVESTVSHVADTVDDHESRIESVESDVQNLQSER